MVIVSILSHVEFRQKDHREDALHCRSRMARLKHLYFRTYAEFNGLIYEEQISVISSFVDGTVVYGTDKMLTKTLRQFSQLKIFQKFHIFTLCKLRFSRKWLKDILIVKQWQFQ